MEAQSRQNEIWTSHRDIVVDLDICRPISMIACLSGMTYPAPQWFINLPKRVRFVWKYVCKLIEWSEVILAVAVLILIYQKTGSNNRAAIQCFGTIMCLGYSFFKGNLLFRKQKELDALVTRVHDVAELLKNNPVHNNEFMKVHRQNYASYLKYSVAKSYFMALAVLIFIGDLTVHGMVYPSPNRPLPMRGYFPFVDRGDNFQFMSMCLVQFLWYLMMGLRDVFGDTTLLLIVAAINVQFVHLKHVMKDIIDRADANNIKFLIGWWVKAHQQVLGTMDDAKTFTVPMILAMYFTTAVLSFILMLRIMENPNIMAVNFLAVSSIMASDMLHLYIFSSLGDTIAYNSQELGWAMMRSNLWELGTDTWRTTMIILTRCTRPTLVVFGDNRVLSASSCGDITTALFGYFNTIYQLRNI